MSARSPYRSAGIALVIGGVISTITSITSSLAGDPSTPLGYWSSVFDLIGGILVLASIGTYYGTFARKGGVLGGVGYLLLFSAGALLAIGGNVMSLVVFPWIAQAAPNLANSAPPQSVLNFFLFGQVLLLIGGLAFGAAILLARAPERGAAILLIVAVLVSFIGQILNDVASLGDIGSAVVTLALAWMGYSLMTRRAVEMTRATDRQTVVGAQAHA